MKPSRILFSFLLIVSLRAGDDEIKKAVASVKEKYCPDRRTVVFDITWENGTAGLVVRGEVDNPNSKAELLDALGKVATGGVIDSIRVLPELSLGKNIYGIVTLSVGNLRSKPGEPEELATQVLMGMVVKVLKKGSGYFYVQSHDQYLGWLDTYSVHLTDESGRNAWASAAKVIVTNFFGIVRELASDEALPVCDAVAGNVFKGAKSSGPWTAVELADGRKGFIPSSLVENYEAWKTSRQLTGENVERAAKMFVGVPYLWGGTSPKGMDCSGFTKTVFRMNGMELNRDANQQALQGSEVPVEPDFKNLKKGDLMFFGRKATAERAERISHVAIYLENKGFIHSSGRVRFGSFDPASPIFDEGNLKRLVRVRRVIPQSTSPEMKQ
jgi:cell wall-associated NlpC family hydrolase